MNDIYEYKEKNLTGYRKIIFNNNIKFLRKLEGVKIIRRYNSSVTFRISDSLLRKIKLYRFSDDIDDKLKFLSLILSKSKKRKEEEKNNEFFGGPYWYNYDFYEDKSDQKYYEKDTNRNYNNYQNVKYKSLKNKFR